MKRVSILHGHCPPAGMAAGQQAAECPGGLEWLSCRFDLPAK